ncbi:hypothetical protein B0T11DRAFT_140539 [Plectosphaerella cucumerina]|uniref:Uncharacterized protein n=1 Tax=Plectosphaerella cucumerina TaxID=40658 RepID=A0A8K0T859_9PEZI|nr:hypothetical protein B0T11DRAFT_140539 [Plectosphaerella cucumerina]
MASNYNTTNNNIPTGYNDPAGTHGPHHSAVGNAMDPRVDSDRDGRALGRDAVNNPGAPGTAGVSTAGYHGAGVGATSTTGTARTATGPGGATSTSQSHNPVQPHSGSGGGLVESVKGRIAQVHGIGESTRGHFNSTVNGLMHDKEGQRKDAAVAAGGEREFANKDFERHGTMDKAL